MRNTLNAVQNNIDVDLKAVDTSIQQWLVQVEQLFKAGGAQPSETKVAIARQFRAMLLRLRMLRNKLIAQRTLLETVSVN